MDRLRDWWNRRVWWQKGLLILLGLVVALTPFSDDDGEELGVASPATTLPPTAALQVSTTSRTPTTLGVQDTITTPTIDTTTTSDASSTPATSVATAATSTTTSEPPATTSSTVQTSSTLVLDLLLAIPVELETQSGYNRVLFSVWSDADGEEVRHSG